MFICGTGRLLRSLPAMCAHSGPSAAALKHAIEAPRIALAPKRPLFAVPSSAIRVASMAS